LETEPGFLLAVTPDKHIESIDGHMPLEIMTGINFNKAMPRKITHRKYHKAKSPYMEKIKKGQSIRNLLIECNED
jgi:hypothetical protein